MKISSVKYIFLVASYPVPSTNGPTEEQRDHASPNTSGSNRDESADEFDNMNDGIRIENRYEDGEQPVSKYECSLS